LRKQLSFPLSQAQLYSFTPDSSLPPPALLSPQVTYDQCLEWGTGSGLTAST